MAFQTLSQIKQGGTQNPAVVPTPKVAVTSKPNGFQTLSQIKTTSQSATTTPDTGVRTLSQIKIEALPQPTGIINKVKNVIPQTIQSMRELKIDPLSLKKDPKKALSSAWEALKTSVEDEKQRINDYLSEFKNDKNKKLNVENYSRVAGKTAKVGVGLANIAFSPISALFAGAEQIPVLGSIAKLVTLPFTAVGEGGTALSNSLVDKLPISQEIKDNIKPALGEIFALAGQITLGKIAEMSKKKIELTKKYGTKDAEVIIEKAQELAKEKIESTKPIVTEKITDVRPKVDKIGLQVEQPTKTGLVEAKVEPVVEKKTSKVGASIEAKAIEKSLAKSFEGTAEYTPAVIKDQSIRVDKILKQDTKNIEKYISGEKLLPSGMREAAFIKGVEDYAFKKGNSELLRELAQSPLVSNTSLHASELRLLAERNPDSPVKLMKDVIDARESAYEKVTGKSTTKAKEEVTKKVQEKVKKNAPTKTEWMDFVRLVECGGL